MATDPATLFAQSACYACFTNGGTGNLLEIGLMLQWADNAQGLPNNLVPPGATFNASGQYFLPVNQNQTYHITFSLPNTTSIINGLQGFGPPQNNTPLTAQAMSLTINGIANALVLAVVTTP